MRIPFPFLLASALALIGCSNDSSSPGKTASGGTGGSGGTSGTGGAGGSTGGSGGTSPGEVTFTPAAITLDEADVTNTLRGQYLWLGTPEYPAGWSDVDSYQRWNWDDIELSHQNYAWQKIDDQIAAAKQRHGRFGMRIMALCQGCGGHVYQGAQSSIPDDLAAVANPLIAAAPGETEKYVIPDWNSQAYLDRLNELVQAIASRYHDEPTFAFVDVFSYGNWGEFHLYPFNQPGGPYDSSTQKPITDANAKLLVDRAAAAFDNKILVINSENAAALAEAVASTSPPIGIRVDCLGSDDLAGGGYAMSQVPGADQRWRSAPFITEWCQTNLGNSGADLFVQGEQQVRDYHVSMLSSGNFSSNPASTAESDAFRKANVEAGYRLRAASVTLDVGSSGSVHVKSHWLDDGVAPTYLAWKVMLGFKGSTTLEVPLAVDLKKVMPDAALDDDESVALPSALAGGSYDVYLRVEDAQQVALPMQLAMQGRDADGNYVLGSITVP